jgi:hypothetical protein
MSLLRHHAPDVIEFIYPFDLNLANKVPQERRLATRSQTPNHNLSKS